MIIDRSTFTLSPGLSSPRLLRSRVSFMAVTTYSSPSIFTTVRHTPLWATLWSIFSSPTNEHVSVRSILSLSCVTALTVANSSIIPENMIVVVYIYK